MFGLRNLLSIVGWTISMENQFLHDCNSFIESGLVAGGKDSKEARQTALEGELCEMTKPLEVTLPNEIESVPACSILDQSENCSRQRMSMITKNVPMVSFLTTLYGPIVLKKWYMPKLKKFCIKRFVCRHVCSQKLSSKCLASSIRRPRSTRR